MPKRSAGLVVYRRPGVDGVDDVDGAGALEVLLVHPGGPFWARKDAGAWSIPKGEYEESEDPFAVAVREFHEELGTPPPAGGLLDLGEVRQAGGKHVRCWAVEGDLDVTTTTSNEFEMEWPPRSGRLQWFPEVDRAAWFAPSLARVKLLKSQLPFLDRLHAALAPPSDPADGA